MVLAASVTFTQTQREHCVIVFVTIARDVLLALQSSRVVAAGIIRREISVCIGTDISLLEYESHSVALMLIDVTVSEPGARVVRVQADSNCSPRRHDHSVLQYASPSSSTEFM